MDSGTEGAPDARLSRCRAILDTPEMRRRYPRSARYDPAWILENHVGSHCLWLTESLCSVLRLDPGMRVLDLGCGKAITSIFLAREFGVQVWAADLWTPPTENMERIRAAGVQDSVFPLHVDARSLPFADAFFHAIVSINALQYFATDDMYIRQHLARLVPIGAPIGAVVPGFRRELHGTLPAAVLPHWGPALYNWHAASWWAWHWEKTGQLRVRVADELDDGEGYAVFRRWEEVIGDSTLCLDDRGENVTFVRVVADRVA
jgi:SAM-dependent methyltransferase